MSRVVLTGVAVFVLVLTSGCCCVEVSECCATGSNTMINVADARTAATIEMAVTRSGAVSEIEYHVIPSDAPQAVRDAMDKLFPGDGYVGAEKEREGGRLYWELAREVDGKKVEAMFTPGGTLHSLEIEIDQGEVPQAVRDAIAAKWPSAPVKAWEVIKDRSQKITEYHVKLTHAGKALKVIVTPGGTITHLYQEMVAEIEVPQPLP